MSALDLLIVWLVPFAALALTWLGASLAVFLVTRSTQWDLRYDLEHRVARRRENRSGAGARLSFGYVASSLLADNCVQATVLHRLAAALVRGRARRLAGLVHGLSKFLTHADISPRAKIGPGFCLYHGLGVVIGKGTVIGRNAVVWQGVTVGGGPTIGDEVVLWAGAKVIGNVAVGSRSEVGANAVVVRDVPPNAIAVGVPADRHIPRREGGEAAARVLGGRPDRASDRSRVES